MATPTVAKVRRKYDLYDISVSSVLGTADEKKSEFYRTGWEEKEVTAASIIPAGGIKAGNFSPV